MVKSRWWWFSWAYLVTTGVRDMVGVARSTGLEPVEDWLGHVSLFDTVLILKIWSFNCRLWAYFSWFSSPCWCHQPRWVKATVADWASMVHVDWTNMERGSWINMEPEDWISMDHVVFIDWFEKLFHFFFQDRELNVVQTNCSYSHRTDWSWWWIFSFNSIFSSFDIRQKCIHVMFLVAYCWGLSIDQKVWGTPPEQGWGLLCGCCWWILHPCWQNHLFIM